MTVYWICYLVILVFGGFVVGETIALITGGQTLSRFVWAISAAFPPFPYFIGFLAGFLTCHFWWGGIVAFESVVRVMQSLLKKSL